MQEVINVPINNSTWTKVELNENQHCGAYGFRSRTGADFKIKRTAESTTYFSILGGTSLSIEEEFIGQGTLFYAQTVSEPSEILEIIVIR